MGKRALGIPSVDASKRSMNQRWSSLGIGAGRRLADSVQSSPTQTLIPSTKTTPGERIRHSGHARADAPALRTSTTVAPRSSRPSDFTTQIVEWTLPVSKTDTRAKACTRSWGCLCAALPSSVCPFHLMVRYLEALRQRFTTADNQTLDPGMPPFPDHQRQVVRKTGVVNSLENVLSRLGIAVTDFSGRRRFGGHSFRVTAPDSG